MTLSFSLQYNPPDYLPKVYEELPMTPSHREVVINAFVYVHQTLHQANERLAKRGGRVMAITPRHYLDFINHYVSIRIEGEVRLYYHEYLSQVSAAISTMHVCLGNSRWPENLFLIVTLVEFHLASSDPLMVIFSYSHVIILSPFFFF